MSKYVVVIKLLYFIIDSYYRIFLSFSSLGKWLIWES